MVITQRQYTAIQEITNLMVRATALRVRHDWSAVDLEDSADHKVDQLAESMNTDTDAWGTVENIVSGSRYTDFDALLAQFEVV